MFLISFPNVVRTGLVDAACFDRSSHLINYTAADVAKAFLNGIASGKKTVYVRVIDRFLAVLDFVFPQVRELVDSNHDTRWRWCW